MRGMEQMSVARVRGRGKGDGGILDSLLLLRVWAL